MKNRVLLIDDNEDMIFLISLFIKQEGFDVSVAKNGKEGLRKLSEDPSPDLIILDHNMEVMDGPTFLLEVENKYPMIFQSVPIVMMTAYEARQVSPNKATEVIRKNGSLDQIELVLKKYCSNK